ncbi:MAG: GWxTD domain-containing protein [candidate division WOR-3 bacterium]
MLCGFLVIITALWAQSYLDYFPAYQDTAVLRNYEYYFMPVSEALTSLKIFYDIPYGKLFFYKDSVNFTNRHTVIVRLFSKRQLLTEQLFSKSFQVPTYEQTLSYDQSHLDSVELKFYNPEAPRSNLSCQLELSDQISSRIYKVTLPIVRHAQDVYLALDKNRQINPSRIYLKSALPTETLGIRIYLPQSNAQTCSLIICSEDPKCPTIISTQLALALEKTPNVYYYNPEPAQISNLKAGNYQVVAKGYDNQGQLVFSAAKSFKIKGSVFEDDDIYKELVNRLIYIASEAELKKLKKVPPQARESTWRTFWAQFDPHGRLKLTEQEYFAKIRYCEENFSRGDRGYRSDRARIYMKYGEPDHIDRQPFEPYYYASEIWYYYSIGKKFIFLDLHGFGEYTLYAEQRI